MRRTRAGIVVVLAVATSLVGLAGPAPARTSARVLRVGSWHGIRGTFRSIQAAVDAAHPGDWVLVGPGDWKERGDYTTHPPSGGESGFAVAIDVPRLHLRGMNRDRVVVDGTKRGSPTCSKARADQDFGPMHAGSHVGRNGIVVDKASGVTIDNLTACNFLGGGNQIWWNGGDGSGKVGMGAYRGSYLSATTTYYRGSDPQAGYGIFVSNARGPGLITRTYASNMNDSSYYIGACPDCNAVLDRAHAENSALGYSGTNSGGHLIIQNGEWDNNATGIVTNSQNNDDAPSPQDGACPSGHGPTGTSSCEVWRNNYVHDNNNPNVPEVGSAAAGPVGTGMVVAGGRNDTLVHNRVVRNKAWGILTTPYPDTEVPPSDIGQHCQGGAVDFDLSALGFAGTIPCYFSDWGSEVAHNSFAHNGGYGNPTNGDIADLSTVPPENVAAHANCWHGNTDTAGALTQWPATLGQTNAKCGQVGSFPDPLEESALALQVSCDTQALFACSPPPGVPAQYPQTTKVALAPLPAEATMPHPCAGVPVNPWCPAKPAGGTGGTGGSGSGGSGGTGNGTGQSTQGSGSPGLSDTGLPVAVPLGGLALLLVAGAAIRLRRQLTWRSRPDQ